MSLKVKNVKIDWVYHACFKISNSKVIYIDPYKIAEAKEKADIILITHDHFDHCDVSSIRKLIKEGTTIIASESCRGKIQNATFVKEGDTVEVDGVKIKVFPAYNTNKPFHPKGKGVGYLIEIDGVKIYHAGDTDVIDEMKELAKENVDVALLPISGTYVMNEEEAVKAALLIKPSLIIPMHYKSDVINADVSKFEKEAKEKGINYKILEPLINI